MSITARRYHHGDLRGALLARAEATLERTGAAGLSLRELAREVGVSHGAPRRHFADREALLLALAESGFVRLRAALGTAAEDDGERGCTERLRATAQAYATFATRHAALLDLMFTAKHGPSAPESLALAARSTFEPLRRLILDGQAAGDVVAGDPDRVGLVLFATVHGIAALAGAGLLEPSGVEADVDEAVSRLLAGLAPR